MDSRSNLPAVQTKQTNLSKRIRGYKDKGKVHILHKVLSEGNAGYKCVRAAMHTHTHRERELSDKQRLCVGSLVGLSGNMR